MLTCSSQQPGCSYWTPPTHHTREPVFHKCHLMLPVWEQKQTSVAGLELGTNGDPPRSSFLHSFASKWPDFGGFTVLHSLRQEEPSVGATTEKWFGSGSKCNVHQLKVNIWTQITSCYLSGVLLGNTGGQCGSDAAGPEHVHHAQLESSQSLVAPIVVHC